MSDIFEDLFGGMGGFGGFSGFGGRDQGPRPTRGNDILMRMDLTFDEAIYGCEKKFNLDVVEECDECHGQGGFDREECSVCHAKYDLEGNEVDDLTINATGHSYSEEYTKDELEKYMEKKKAIFKWYKFSNKFFLSNISFTPFLIT